MAMKEKTTEIEDEATYTLKDIVDNGWMPHVSSFPAVRNLVLKDKEKDNILNTRITGEGRNRRYSIKGENLKEFIRKLGREYHL